MGEKITEPFPFCVDDFFPKDFIALSLSRNIFLSGISYINLNDLFCRVGNRRNSLVGR